MLNNYVDSSYLPELIFLNNDFMLHIHRYDKAGVMEVLSRTNFSQSDGHDAWNSYKTTENVCFLPKVVKCKANSIILHSKK